MELSPANRSALLLRFSATFGADRSYPGWNGLSLVDQLAWQDRDPEAAAIAKGDVPANVEAWLCVNTLSPELPYREDPKAAYQAKLNEAITEMQQQNAERAAVREEREQFQRQQAQYLNGISAGRRYY